METNRCNFVCFLWSLIVNTANLVFIWLLFSAVNVAKEGLVFGPPHRDIEPALLAFSILGSVFYIVGIISEWYEAFRTNSCAELISVFILWIVELPQMIINIIIVVCREEAVSYWQLVKASAAIFARLLPCIRSWCKMCSKCGESTKSDKCCLALGSFGYLLTLGCAITIFIYTQTERNADGSLNVKERHNILEGELDDRKYFANVSIYFSHSIFDYEVNPSVDRKNLVRLLSIHDLTNSKTDRTVNIKYDSTQENFLIQIDGKYEKCFQKMNGKVTKQTVCSHKLPKPAGQFAITFHYVEPSFPSLLFGDITYNMKSGNNPNCETPDYQVVNNMYAHIDNPSSAMMRYYRTKPNISEEYHIRQMSGDSYEFYQESDLINIEDVWNTYDICKSTGSRAPHMDDQLEVLCQQ